MNFYAKLNMKEPDKYVCTFCNVKYADPKLNQRPVGTISLYNKLSQWFQTCGICKGKGFVDKKTAKKYGKVVVYRK